MAIPKIPTKEQKKRLAAAGIKPGEIYKYEVVNGCDVPGKRYEVGQPYNPADHDEKTTETLLRLKAIEVRAIEKTNGDS